MELERERESVANVNEGRFILTIAIINYVVNAKINNVVLLYF